MTELTEINPSNYDINLFDISPESIVAKEFTDDSGTKQTFWYGELTYNGISPFMLKEGDSYGVQDANEKKTSSKSSSSAPDGMVELEGSKKKKKPAKWQISIQLTSKPGEKEWAPEEKPFIDFWMENLPQIYGTVLSRSDRLTILQKVASEIIPAAQKKFTEERQEHPEKYQTEEEQLARLRKHIADEVARKVSKKVYRKKLESKDDKSVNLLAAATDQYDQTKHPSLYVNINHYTTKETKELVVNTKYYQYEEGVSEEDWKEYTHEEAIKLGWQRLECAMSFGKTYFGGKSISPQISAAEVVFKHPIGTPSGHKGRLVKARGEIKKNTRLVKRSAIQPVNAPPTTNSNNEPTSQTLTNEQVTQSQVDDAKTANTIFDPSALANIPGLSVPSVVN